MRMPFRFGPVTMTEMAVLYLRLRLEVDGAREVEGTSASVLSPMWFDKDPTRGYEEKERRLLTSVGLAVRRYEEAGPDTAHALHCEIQPEVRRRCAELGIGPLGSSYGVALLDGAVVDGLCRLHGASLHDALAGDLLGFGPVPWLPAEPLSGLHLRHTVGLVDPLVEDEVEERLDDGLPQTLEEVVREYGCSWFKIKISADVGASLERLRRIDEVLDRVAAPHWRAVLDGNEQFVDLSAFAELHRAMRADPRLRSFWSRLAWFEQPVERDASLDDSVAGGLRRLGPEKPVILDESDGADEVVERALELGYGGVSAKNCKGVFRTLHSRAVLAASAGPAILAAEDLTSPGGLALQQDTAVVATLGIEHAERNGHHYVRGLDHLTAEEQESALRAFPELYERRADGLARLRIEGGLIRTAGVARRGYGGPSCVDFEALEPAALPAVAPLA